MNVTNFTNNYNKFTLITRYEKSLYAARCCIKAFSVLNNHQNDLFHNNFIHDRSLIALYL
ncbi:hypothetical protein EV194_11661 [Natronoflexus pectinivorans]|uniref:Uncharacterized protein n=1 Tax=Natronoflexus pectinivorans TaxID=682526 RepID=A0A4R2GDP5_9BACT|nr:hypothetical protein EV194_11661 [Natronoflexus pectinivorans]